MDPRDFDLNPHDPRSVVNNPAYRSRIGIAQRFIQHFNAQAEREDSLRRWAQAIRDLRLLTMPCGNAKH